jgi:aldehyde:ferredoxin oxidoreductase
MVGEESVGCIKISNPYINPRSKRYYKLRGWDVETGKPLAQTLLRLGLAT